METFVAFLWLMIKIDLATGIINAILLVIVNLTAVNPKKGPGEAFALGFIIGLIPFANLYFPFLVYIPSILDNVWKNR